MATYLTLLNRALSQVNMSLQTEAIGVAQVAIEEAMKFVAFHVRIPSLIPRATATAPAAGVDGTILVNLVTHFGLSLSTYQQPERLYVADDSSKVTSTTRGRPYEFFQYHHYMDIKNSPGSYRFNIDLDLTYDKLPNYTYTIDSSNNMIVDPVKTGNFLTFEYRISPAPYADGTTPEISAMFDFILVNGTVLALKEWLREPDQLLSYWDIFQALMPSIETYKDHIQGGRRRTQIKIHDSYRPN